MLRTIAVFSFPAALIALAWLRLEETPASGGDGLWVVLLALAPALAPTLVLRLALIAPAALTAAWVALDTPVHRCGRHGFFGPVLDRFGDGFLDYYDVEVPFSGVQQPNMHGVLVLAIFGFCLVLAQAIAARRPLLAVLRGHRRRRLARHSLSVRERPLRRAHPRRGAVRPRGATDDAAEAGARRRARRSSSSPPLPRPRQRSPRKAWSRGNAGIRT